MADNKIPVICVKDLYKIYRVGESKVRALNGVDFTIYKGEFCAIVGTSGSGKSTLLNMLAGLEKPTKGEIVIAGEHIENKTENQLVRFRREHIGFIFQSFNLLSTMTALENVALPLTFQGVDKAKRLKKASALLDLVKLGKYKITGRLRCPADNSRESAWRGHSWLIRRSFLRTNRPETLTPIRPEK